MFSSLTTRLRAEVETLKHVLDTHDRLRAVVFPQPEVVDQAGERIVEAAAESRHPPGTDEGYLIGIRADAPTKAAWQVYDHCAAFTRLYAVYEQFIEDLVSEYLRMLPALYPRYEDLPPNVTRQHRVGVGQILLRFGKDGPFKELQEREIIQGISEGLLGRPSYTLFPQAFLTDPQNYRSETVIKLFSYVGFENCWPWVDKHPLMGTFMELHRDPNETPKTLLHEFVEYRNKASHTVVRDIVATEEIKSIADFVVVLSETLAQLVMKQVVGRKKALGEAMAVGSVLHRFTGNIVGAKMWAGEIATGDELIVVQKQACFRATVLSIQVHQTPCEGLTVQEGQEIGIGLSEKVNVNAELVRLGRLGQEQRVVTLVESMPEPTSPDEEQPSGEAETADGSLA